MALYAASNDNSNDPTIARINNEIKRIKQQKLLWEKKIPQINNKLAGFETKIAALVKKRANRRTALQREQQRRLRRAA